MPRLCTHHCWRGYARVTWRMYSTPGSPSKYFCAVSLGLVFCVFVVGWRHVWPLLLLLLLLLIEGLSLLQSIPPTTANKQAQAQKKRGSRARKLLGANAKSYRLKLKTKTT